MYNPLQLSKLEETFTKDSFKNFYDDCKYEGLLDIEIAGKLKTDYNTLKFLKELYDVKTIVIRKNKSGLKEEHFRKGSKIGLGRRIILRRVRDGMSIEQAISTPKNKKKISHRRKRK